MDLYQISSVLKSKSHQCWVNLNYKKYNFCIAICSNSNSSTICFYDFPKKGEKIIEIERSGQMREGRQIWVH